MMESPSPITTIDRNQPKRDRADYFRKYRADKRPSPGLVPEVENLDPRRFNTTPLKVAPRPIPKRKCALGLCDQTDFDIPNRLRRVDTVDYDKPFCASCYQQIVDNKWEGQPWLQVAIEESRKEFNLERKDAYHGLMSIDEEVR